jgi:hypothetical protein
MKINLMNINNYSNAKSSAVKANLNQSNSVQANVSFKAISINMINKRLLNYLSFNEKRPDMFFDGLIKSLERGKDHYNALTSLTSATEFKNVSSLFFDIAESYEKTAHNGYSTVETKKYLDLSSLLQSPLPDFMKKLEKIDIDKITKIKIDPSTAKEEITRLRENLIRAWSNLGKIEKIAESDRAKTVAEVADSFLDASIYLNKLGIYFSEQKGARGSLEMYYSLADTLANCRY